MNQEIPFPNREAGYVCKCCGSFCKLYRRKLNSNMALVLCTLLKNKVNGFVHLENFMSENGYKRCGDASYLGNYTHLHAA